MKTQLIEKNLIRLGSAYGGWTILGDGSLNKGTVISAGLGEDASFDVEMINKYDCSVLAVDPTPRSSLHFDEIKKSFGANKINDYTEGGKQPISAYNLSKVNIENYQLLRFGLSDSNGQAKFYRPSSPGFVSHSLESNQNSSANDYFKIEVICIRKLLEKFGKRISLLKLDIEGSEFRVLKSLSSNDLLPYQICVEFDFIRSETKKTKRDFHSLVEHLRNLNYEFIFEDGLNYTLVHRDIL